MAAGEQLPRSRAKPVIIGLAAVALALAIFVFIFVSQQITQRRLVAKAEASVVLSKVEECESAVTVGVNLKDLSKKAIIAREKALAFSRSEHGVLMPNFSKAVTLAAQDYVDSAGSSIESRAKQYCRCSYFPKKLVA